MADNNETSELNFFRNVAQGGLPCKYCGTEIDFNPNIRSERTKKLVPLEADNHPHRCPERKTWVAELR